MPWLDCVFIELLSLVDPSTQDDLPRTKLGAVYHNFSVIKLSSLTE